MADLTNAMQRTELKIFLKETPLKWDATKTLLYDIERKNVDSDK